MVAPQEDAIRPDVSVNDALAVQVADSGDQLAEYDPFVDDTAVHVVDQLVAVHSQVAVAQIRHYVSEICKFWLTIMMPNLIQLYSIRQLLKTFYYSNILSGQTRSDRVHVVDKIVKRWR